MDYDDEKRIRELILRYKFEIKDIDKNHSYWDKDYSKGYKHGEQGALEWVVKDLEKIVNKNG